MAMKRAVQNLISNAQKYGENSRVSLEVTSNGAVICVEDDGPGIDPELREAAFLPFQRLDDARNQNIEGVGLGLSIARDVSQTHGGNLSLESSSMGGLKAILKIPV
jgi:two-component system osmolarity sensor histidine kinase EnvZ